MSHMPSPRYRAFLLPAMGGVFLSFMLGLGLGTTGRPPSGLLRQAISGVSDMISYSRDAFFATPSQHLRPRGHAGNGVTVSVPARMQPGVTLLSGLFGQTLGFRLYAADGTLLKEWPIDFFKIAPDEMNHRYHALIHGEYLYSDGDIVANLDGRGLVRFDACGKIRWRNHDRTHHSVFVDENGDIWTPLTPDPQSDATIAPKPFTMDHVARFDPDTGEKLEEIDLLKALQDGPGTGLVQTNHARLDDVLHINDVEVLSTAMAPAFPMFRAGDLLVSSRNLSQLWVIDRQTKTIKWWFAGPNLSQHDPDFRADGTIAMFDNRPSGDPSPANDFVGTLGGSRILVIDPATGKSRAVYRGDAQNTFYSPYRGKQELEPNGNMLIAETDAGRAFEVTPDGTVVWDYVNGWDETRVGWVMGAARYPESYAAIASLACD